MMINESWFQDGFFLAFKRPSRDFFYVAQKAGVIETLEGTVAYEKGFYILSGPHGEQYPVSPDTFHEIRVDNGDGTSSPIKIIKKAKRADHSGSVSTTWGELLYYVPDVDVIVRHGVNKYGVVKREIFDKTYEVLKS